MYLISNSTCLIHMFFSKRDENALWTHFLGFIISGFWFLLCVFLGGVEGMVTSSLVFEKQIGWLSFLSNMLFPSVLESLDWTHSFRVCVDSFLISPCSAKVIFKDSNHYRFSMSVNSTKQAP